MGRYPRFHVRISDLSDRTAAAGHALPAVDAAFRLRRRGRGTAVLARAASAQHPGAGALFSARRRRCVAFQLLARQRITDLDAYAPFYRVLVAAAVTGVAAPARLKPAHAAANPDIIHADLAGPLVRRPWQSDLSGRRQRPHHV